MKYILPDLVLLLFITIVGSNNINFGSHEKLKHVHIYNETLSPKIEDLTTIPSCSISVTWSCDQCEDFGLSKFIVHWSDGTEGSYDVNDTTFSYVINGLNAATNYSILVSAVYGGDADYESNSEYTVTDVGNPPNIDWITVNSVSDTEISLSWNTSNQDCPVKGYDIQYNGVDLCLVGEDDTGSAFSTETSKNLTDLSPYTSYTISIAAISTDEIFGNVTSIPDVSTYEAVPGPPDSVDSVPLNSSSVLVSWEAPTDCNGFIYNYFISWKLTGDDVIIDQAERYYLQNYTVNDLRQCEQYDFLVSAATSAGEGDPTNSTSTTLAEAPPPMETLTSTDISSRSAVLTWTPADTPCPFYYTLEGNGTVLWDDQNVTDGGTMPGNETFYEANDLVPWTNYSVCIAATTGGGTSEPACTEFQTLQDVPGSPVNLTTVEDSIISDSFKIRWREPVEKNGQLSKFSVYLINTEDEVVETHDVSYNASTIIYEVTFIDLSSSYHYRANVSAQTIAGYGKPAETSATTKDDSNLGLVLGITIPVIVIVVAAAGLGYYHREKIRSRVESFRS